MQTTESENWVVLSTTHQHVLRAFCGRESSCDGFDPTQKVQLWGKQRWFSPGGAHSRVDLAVNAVAVGRSTREELTDKKKYNIFLNKQSLRVGDACPSTCNLHERVLSKYETKMKSALRKRHVNAAQSMWKESIASVRDPRLKGYAEVMASPLSPFYLCFNTKSIGRKGGFEGNIHVFMGIEFQSLQQPFGIFPQPVRIGSCYR